MIDTRKSIFIDQLTNLVALSDLPLSHQENIIRFFEQIYPRSNYIQKIDARFTGMKYQSLDPSFLVYMKGVIDCPIDIFCL